MNFDNCSLSHKKFGIKIAEWHLRGSHETNKWFPSRGLLCLFSYPISNWRQTLVWRPFYHVSFAIFIVCFPDTRPLVIYDRRSTGASLATDRLLTGVATVGCCACVRDGGVLRKRSANMNRKCWTNRAIRIDGGQLFDSTSGEDNQMARALVDRSLIVR